MKVKKPKILKKFSTKKKGSKEVVETRDEVNPDITKDDSGIQFTESGEGAKGSRSLEEASQIDSENLSPFNETVDDGSDWETEGGSSYMGTETSADLMKCLNNLRIRSVSKSQTSSAPRLPKLAPPPPSLSSRGSFELRGSVDDPISIKSYGSLKMRNSLASVQSSFGEPASLIVDTRSQDGSPSPAVLQSRPMSAASNGIARSQWSVGISEASELSPSESSTVVITRTDASIQEGNHELSSRASNFEEDVKWNAFPTSPRENISKSPGTSVEVDGADSSKQEMNDTEGEQREAFMTQSSTEVCKDGNDKDIGSVQPETSPQLASRTSSSAVPTEWQQFSAPSDDSVYLSTGKEASHQGSNLRTNNADFDPGASNDEVIYISQDSEQPAEESPMSAPRSPNPFAQSEDFAKSNENGAWEVISPRLPPIATHNPFVDDHLSVKSSEEIFTGTASQQENFLKDPVLDSAFHHTGFPQLQIVETVNATFAGDKLSRFLVSGEVRMKLSAGHHLDSESHFSQMNSKHSLPLPDSEAFEPYSIVFQLKCISQNVYLKQFLANLEMMENTNKPMRSMPQTPSTIRHRRTNSLSMNDARKGIVESRLLEWSLSKCIAAAHSQKGNGNQGVVLLRYSIRSNAGPPLRVQVRWRRPRKAGQSIYVDVAVMPGQHMTSSLWGVTITLKGLEHLAEKQGIPQGKAVPKAEWSSQASAFQWRIPVIYPEDGVRHFRLVVTDAFGGKPKDGAFNLSADISFVIPHTSLSGTSIHGWVEKKGSADDFNEDFGESEGPMVYRSVFCDKMCITGAYVANINYQ